MNHIKKNCNGTFDIFQHDEFTQKKECQFSAHLFVFIFSHEITGATFFSMVFSLSTIKLHPMNSPKKNPINRMKINN